MPSEMLACTRCHGDGYLRLEAKTLPSAFNVAWLHYADGWYSGKCQACDGLGIFEYRRGGSLTPLVGSRDLVEEIPHAE